MSAFRQSTAVIIHEVFTFQQSLLFCVLLTIAARYNVFINTADLFLIKEFHSSGLWSLNFSNPKNIAITACYRLFSLFCTPHEFYCPKTLHCQQVACEESGGTGPASAQQYPGIKRTHTQMLLSGLTTISFRDWEILSLKQSTAVISRLPRKVESLHFCAVGFIFMPVSHMVLFTIPSLQLTSAIICGPDFLISRNDLNWKAETQERRKRDHVLANLTIMQFTLQKKTGESSSGKTVGSKACLHLRSQQKDCMATRLLFPAWISNHSIMFNLKISERKWRTSINHWLVIISWTVCGEKKQGSGQIRVSEL